MSLFGAMNTAISGLNSQSGAFSNISDNVANSQTTGFKRVDTAFIDYLTSSTARENDSGSVVAIPQYVNNVQGTIAQSDNPLALAIAGQGFFSVSQSTGVTNGVQTFSSQPYFTRAGDFSLNKDGYLVNSAGNFLNGWAVNSATGAVSRTTVAPIQVSQTVLAPVATTSLTLSANLPATPTPPATAAAPMTSQINVYDSLGTAQTVTLNWSQATPPVPDAWTVTATLPGGATAGSADVTFGGVDAHGNPIPTGTIGSVNTNAGSPSAETASGPYNASQPASFTFPTTFSGITQNIQLNLGNYGQSTGVTQFAGTAFALRGISQNGIPPGSFSSVTTKATGDVIVNYDNGQTRTIARAPVVTFADPNALQRGDGQVFSATIDSGVANANDSNINGAGNLITGSIEASNVDIAQEFTKLIVAQRAYTANTKIVTTSDELLQATIDMKR